MAERGSLFESLDAAALAAIEAVGALYESLATDVRHPQEFGSVGCPACRARDLVAEAADALTQAREVVALWQPESITA